MFFAVGNDVQHASRSLDERPLAENVCPRLICAPRSSMALRCAAKVVVPAAEVRNVRSQARDARFAAGSKRAPESMKPRIGDDGPVGSRLHDELSGRWTV